MVEFINKLTESQASDKVHKVLRADPDKKRSRPEQERDDADEKKELDEPKDELVLSKVTGAAGSDKDAAREQVEEVKIKNKIENKKDDESPVSHIDVKV